VKIALDVIVTDDTHDVFVFVRPARPDDEFNAVWALWEGGEELSREIGVALIAAVDALSGEAAETMRRFVGSALVELLAEEDRRLDEEARRSEWSA
jgi:hypothetical protein